MERSTSKKNLGHAKRKSSTRSRTAPAKPPAPKSSPKSSNASAKTKTVALKPHVHEKLKRLMDETKASTVSDTVELLIDSFEPSATVSSRGWNEGEQEEFKQAWVRDYVGGEEAETNP